MTAAEEKYAVEYMPKAKEDLARLDGAVRV